MPYNPFEVVSWQETYIEDISPNPNTQWNRCSSALQFQTSEVLVLAPAQDTLHLPAVTALQSCSWSVACISINKKASTTATHTTVLPRQHQKWAYQWECCANPQEVIGDCKAKDIWPLQHVEEALCLLDGCIEWCPLVVASKSAKLYNEVHHEAHGID